MAQLLENTADLEVTELIPHIIMAQLELTRRATPLR